MPLAKTLLAGLCVTTLSVFVVACSSSNDPQQEGQEQDAWTTATIDGSQISANGTIDVKMKGSDSCCITGCCTIQCTYTIYGKSCKCVTATGPVEGNVTVQYDTTYCSESGCIDNNCDGIPDGTCNTGGSLAAPAVSYPYEDQKMGKSAQLHLKVTATSGMKYIFCMYNNSADKIAQAQAVDSSHGISLEVWIDPSVLNATKDSNGNLLQVVTTNSVTQVGAYANGNYGKNWITCNGWDWGGDKYDELPIRHWRSNNSCTTGVYGNCGK